MPKQTINTQIAALEVLTSKKVQSVDVSFDGEFDGIRHYTAITVNEIGERHEYTVRFQEDSDGVRFGKCNCAAGANDVLCRHIIKAALLDSRQTNQELYLPTVAKYKAHRYQPNAEAEAAAF